MFHVKHLMVDRHSSAHLRQVFITSHTSHLTPHTSHPASDVSRETSLTLEAHTTAPPISIALLRFGLGAPRLRHAPSPVVNVSCETSHCWPPLLCPVFARISLHTLASHTQCPMFHVKHLILTHTPPPNFAFATPHPSHSAPLSPRTFTSSDVSRETPVLPQECKRAAASPRKVTPPPIPYDAHADTAGKHRPIPTPPA